MYHHRSAPAPTARPRRKFNRPLLVVAAVAVALAGTAQVTAWAQSAPTASRPPGGQSAGQPKDCAARPSACGYPDGTNTGVPAGTALKRVPQDITRGPGWHWDTRGWIAADTDGAVVSGISTAATVDVTAAHVVVRNVEVHQPNGDFGVAIRHGDDVTVQDSTIYGGHGTDRLVVGVKDIYGDSTNTKVLRNNIHGVATGIQADSGLIQDNYVHDMGYAPGDHTNGTTSNATSGPLTVRHNTVFNQLGQTDAISLFEDFGTQYDRVIDNNLVAGGGYAIYGGQNPGGPTAHDIAITNNRFARKFYPRGGYYGPLAAFDEHGPGCVWSGNFWDDTLAPVS